MDINEAAGELSGISGKNMTECLTMMLEKAKIIGMEKMLNEIYVMSREYYLSGHPYKIYWSESEREWRTYITDESGKRKTLRRKTKDALEKFLIGHYKKQDKTNCTIKELFPCWLAYRRDHTAAKPKTLQEAVYDWNKFYKDSRLAAMKPKDITPVMLIRFFRDLTKDRIYTSKRISSAKGLMNGLFTYCIEEGIVQSNPVNDVRLRNLTFRPEKKDIENVYSLEEAEKLTAHIASVIEAGPGEDGNEEAFYIYALAAMLSFQLFIRIGETKALKWEDIDYGERTISVQRQMLTERQLKDDLTFESRTHQEAGHVKGYTSKGFRKEYLTDEALYVIDKVRKINPHGEYLFMPYGKPMTTDRFNRTLKKLCLKAGVPYRSSHKIRFFNASTAYNGKNLMELSEVLGHSKVSTTMHYLRNVHKENGNKSLFANMINNGIK